ncbi:hypothetical protein KKH82_00355 [Patescibacteria group bacterium]|nr:hypothetical protein [Patescibacteria group bacterium]
MEIAQGSMLLFLTNIIAIILVGIIIFFAFGFFATNNKGQKRSLSTIIITVLMIVAISIPLTNSMKSIANDMQMTKTIEQTTKDFIHNLNEEITIKKSEYQNLETDTIRINTTIEVPDTMIITQEHKNDLSKVLAASTKKSVELDLNIVTLSSIYIEQAIEATQEEVIQDLVNTKIKEYT